MPPMITTTSEFRSHWPSTSGASDANAPPIAPPKPASADADDERDRERELDVHAERRDHVPVVDAGADDHARPRLVQPEPERDADHDRDAEDEEAAPGVDDAADVSELVRADEGRPGKAVLRGGRSAAIIWSARMTETAIVISA